MRNITPEIKAAFAVNALWSISDFYYFLEVMDKNGFKVSHWKGEENWATFSSDSIFGGYIWQKYPLIILHQDFLKEVVELLHDLKYVIIIESNNLNNPEFTLDMDKDVIDKTGYGIDLKSFSANDLWFHTVSL